MTIAQEILLGKMNKTINENVGYLLEDAFNLLNEDTEASILNLKYSKVPDALRRYNFTEKFKEALDNGISPKNIVEMNKFLENSKNMINEKDVENICEGYKRLARLYSLLESKAIYEFEKSDVDALEYLK